jgi:hypothetical protein
MDFFYHWGYVLRVFSITLTAPLVNFCTYTPGQYFVSWRKLTDNRKQISDNRPMTASFATERDIVVPGDIILLLIMTGISELFQNRNSFFDGGMGHEHHTERE